MTTQAKVTTYRPVVEQRLIRLLGIIALVAREPETWNRAALAERFQVSERMITKDLFILRRAGLRIHRRTTGGYYLATPAAGEIAGAIPWPGRHGE